MDEAPAHLHLHRSTEGLDHRDSRSGVTEFIPVASAEDVAPLMLAAYRGTPDDEGETLADAVAILRSAMAGAFGPWLPEASFVALDRSGRSSGAIVIALEDDGTPFIVFVFVAPDRCGHGIASLLISRSCRALSDSGHRTIRLWVNTANERAVSLYRHLGFVEVVADSRHGSSAVGPATAVGK
ncbi:GNAT family N-acetyltransferase [Acidipropionibacterium jensenii]|uniref:GNAT family N-acetyltransferase n=1 Tax=Acidipropionibacterium jensenii TaxID=1749 RepID=UPI00214D098B|nr:GNAT family N-acetyltransferase [Acidipropionibacterium jensenii]